MFPLIIFMTLIRVKNYQWHIMHLIQRITVTCNRPSQCKISCNNDDEWNVGNVVIHVCLRARPNKQTLSIIICQANVHDVAILSSVVTAHDLRVVLNNYLTMSGHQWWQLRPITCYQLMLSNHLFPHAWTTATHCIKVSPDSFLRTCRLCITLWHSSLLVLNQHLLSLCIS